VLAGQSASLLQRVGHALGAVTAGQYMIGQQLVESMPTWTPQ
jgi:hypothetical protein